VIDFAGFQPKKLYCLYINFNMYALIGLQGDINTDYKVTDKLRKN